MLQWARCGCKRLSLYNARSKPPRASDMWGAVTTHLLPVSRRSIPQC